VKVFNRALPGAAATSAIDALRAELQLLREENARLRVQAHRATAGGRSVYQLAILREEAGHLAALQEAAHRAADASDDAWQTLADAIVVRDALLEVCDELVGLTTRLRHRLEDLGPSPLDRVLLLDPAEPLGDDLVGHLPGGHDAGVAKGVR